LQGWKKRLFSKNSECGPTEEAQPYLCTK